MDLHKIQIMKRLKIKIKFYNDIHAAHFAADFVFLLLSNRLKSVYGAARCLIVNSEWIIWTRWAIDRLQTTTTSSSSSFPVFSRDKFSDTTTNNFKLWSTDFLRCEHFSFIQFFRFFNWIFRVCWLFLAIFFSCLFAGVLCDVLVFVGVKQIKKFKFKQTQNILLLSLLSSLHFNSP